MRFYTLLPSRQNSDTSASLPISFSFIVPAAQSCVIFLKLLFFSYINVNTPVTISECQQSLLFSFKRILLHLASYRHGNDVDVRTWNKKKKRGETCLRRVHIGFLGGKLVFFFNRKEKKSLLRPICRCHWHRIGIYKLQVSAIKR